MSLASVYAAAQVTAAADVVTANEKVPPAFVGPNGRAEVTMSGGMRVVPTGTGTLELPPAAALAFAAWITTTFGD